MGIFSRKQELGTITVEIYDGKKVYAECQIKKRFDKESSEYYEWPGKTVFFQYLIDRMFNNLMEKDALVLIDHTRNIAQVLLRNTEKAIDRRRALGQESDKGLLDDIRKEYRQSEMWDFLDKSEPQSLFRAVGTMYERNNKIFMLTDFSRVAGSEWADYSRQVVNGCISIFIQDWLDNPAKPYLFGASLTLQCDWYKQHGLSLALLGRAPLEAINEANAIADTYSHQADLES